MIIIYLIYSCIASLAILLYSLLFVVLFWWYLFIPKHIRFKTFYYFVAVPWIFVVLRIFLLTRLKIIGKKNVDPKRTTLYICNHQSWVDVPIIIRYSRSTGVSKKEVVGLPLVGALILYAGAILVDRVDNSSRIGIIKELISVFKKNISITLFPEGTRSKDGKLLTPNKAVIKLCYKLNVSVVPVAVEGTKEILPKGRIYFKFFQKAIMQFSEPVFPKDFKNEEEFSDHCWNKVIETHNSIIKKYFPDRTDLIS